MAADLDIERFFDRVPHRRLLEDLAIWIDDEAVLALAARWLEGFGRGGRGLAQGAPVSPLLANLFLHPLDRLLTAEGLSHVRYADDLVIACRTRAEARRACTLSADLLRARVRR